MCSAGWHSQPGPLFGGDGWASYGSQMRAVGAAVAPQFKRANWWYVMQGSVIDSAADHNHWCNATHWRDDAHKCWSAGWRLCAQPEVRLQLWSVLLSGVRGIMFYRLGLGGWQQPSNNIDAPLNRSWVAGVLLPALAEMAPHLPAILSGPLRGSGALLPRTNVSEALVSSRLYNCPAASRSASTSPTRSSRRRSGTRACARRRAAASARARASSSAAGTASAAGPFRSGRRAGPARRRGDDPDGPGRDGAVGAGGHRPGHRHRGRGDAHRARGAGFLVTGRFC